MSLRAAGSIAPLGLVWVSWVGSWRFTASPFAVHGQATSPWPAWLRVGIHLLVWSAIYAFRLHHCFGSTSRSLLQKMSASGLVMTTKALCARRRRSVTAITKRDLFSRKQNSHGRF